MEMMSQIPLEHLDARSILARAQLAHPHVSALEWGSGWENSQIAPPVFAPKLQSPIHHSDFRHSDPMTGLEIFLQFNSPSMYQVETALAPYLTTTS